MSNPILYTVAMPKRPKLAIVVSLLQNETATRPKPRVTRNAPVDDHDSDDGPSAGSAVAPRARIAQSSGPIDQGRCDYTGSAQHRKRSRGPYATEPDPREKTPCVRRESRSLETRVSALWMAGAARVRREGRGGTGVGLWKALTQPCRSWVRCGTSRIFQPGSAPGAGCACR